MDSIRLNIENEEPLIPSTVIDSDIFDEHHSSKNRDKSIELFAKLLANSMVIPNSGILDINQIAQILRCSVDTARRIPLEELPSYEGDGRQHLYFRDDIERYIRSRPRLNKRGTGLSSADKLVKHTPVENSNNPARRALSEFCGGVQ